ncbi:MAG: helix-turn-helix domain-containing protein [Iphinoe sp. HA4291-MV1]|jgi:predicted transcriptional regulator|nr:helix-turn-helix domain-containing protein [Iphinoe sp. HA4291-MV1]
MTHKQAKIQARKMHFKVGYSCPDIANILRIPLRTVQRWIKDSRGEELEFSSQDSEGESIHEVVTLVKEGKVHPTLSSDSTWYQEAELLALSQFDAHNSVRIKIEKLLNEQLESPDLNLKIIHCLSLALSRHIDGERQAVSLHLLDINRAVKRVEDFGLQIVNAEGDDCG